MVPRLVMIAGCAVLVCAAAARGNANDQVPAVRTEHQALRDALLTGCQRSATFRSLGRRIQDAHGVVVVNDGGCGARRGCLLHWIAVAGERRYLRMAIDADRPREEVAVTIGHELQHALEVLDDPSIRTAAAIYWRFRGAFTGSQRSYETPEALAIEDRIRAEMARRSDSDVSSPPCTEVFTIDHRQ